jgi:hypothetical protein
MQRLFADNNNNAARLRAYGHSPISSAQKETVFSQTFVP